MAEMFAPDRDARHYTRFFRTTHMPLSTIQAARRSMPPAFDTQPVVVGVPRAPRVAGDARAPPVAGAAGRGHIWQLGH